VHYTRYTQQVIKREVKKRCLEVILLEFAFDNISNDVRLPVQDVLEALLRENTGMLFLEILCTHSIGVIGVQEVDSSSIELL